MADVAGIVAEIVRRERGPLLGGLLRFTGSLDVAEDALQEAVVAALTSFREDVPPNPAAWLMTAAKNSVRDARRHLAVVRAKAPLLSENDVIEPSDLDTVADDHLRLLFTCCHPALATDSQIALTLKVVCGFSTEEIARSFLGTEATVSQRILRAKRALEEVGPAMAAPERSELGERVMAVLGVVYAMFNEGHIGHTGSLMRVDLQAEALRLGRLVCDLSPREPEAFGLLSLMAFHASRARTRVGADGEPILLSEQDRSRWDKELLREGLMARARARSLGGRGNYALQAELAAVHATALTWESTDWAALVRLYDALLAEAPSPLVKMNRAIALSMLRGPDVGLEALREIEGDLDDYHLFYATRADLRSRAGQDPTQDLDKALSLATNDAERRLLEGRLERVRKRP